MAFESPSLFLPFLENSDYLCTSSVEIEERWRMTRKERDRYRTRVMTGIGIDVSFLQSLTPVTSHRQNLWQPKPCRFSGNAELQEKK